LSRGKYEKRHSKKYDETEREKREKKRAMGKFHVNGNKVFPMVSIDSLF
jgi:hypothetical protein